MSEPIGERFMVTRKDGDLVAEKMFTYHPKANGTEARFEVRQESDGSQRLIELLPAFLKLSDSSSGSNNVYIIDEIDRSLHTLLTRKLIEAYLANCSKKSRSQLLLTTHDVLLMDQELLRRDEMWVTERNALGVSSLIPFSDYKDIRYDKDIRKSYLQGRMGGIPRFLLTEGLTDLHRKTEKAA
uniref:AAA domain-containing protein, putative AbiEii toxin, Type IV TA system n=1 Tax=Candidatus Kentrum sp. LFY TaxID=2126342 RepID=A0A450U7U4_9GAMM|nr:MAG: AAA domain-containing protein, putative AbiEii toxin, Type IV TA system [Candidatus Kentron sp. LFY]